MLLIITTALMLREGFDFISGTYIVLGVSDISRPQSQIRKEDTGRIIEEDTDEEGQTENGKIPTNRCLKFALGDILNLDKVVLAFEQLPLPYSMAELLGCTLSVKGVERRHGHLLLTPTNCERVPSPLNKSAQIAGSIPMIEIRESELDEIIIGSSELE